MPKKGSLAAKTRTEGVRIVSKSSKEADETIKLGIPTPTPIPTETEAGEDSEHFKPEVDENQLIWWSWEDKLVGFSDW